MNCKYILFSALSLIATTINAQQPVFDINFSNVPGALQDYSIKRTNDNGSLSFQSYTTPNTVVPTWNVYVKRDSVGAVQWAKRMDFNALSCQNGAIITCASNGYMEFTPGHVPNSLGSNFCKGTRIDANGNFLWGKTYLFTGPIYTVQNTPKFCQNTDGGYMLGASVLISPNNQYEYGIQAMRTDSFGNVLWSNIHLQDTRMIVYWCMDLCSNGDMVISATRLQPDCSYAIDLIRVDQAGNLIWGKEYFIPMSSVMATSIKETANNEIMIAGTHGSSRNLLMRLDANGQVIWSNSYSCFYAKEMVLTPDGGVLIATNEAINSNIFTLLMKTDGAGSILWSKRYTYLQEPRIDLTASGGILISGQDYFSQTLIQADSFGNSNCQNIPVQITSYSFVCSVLNVSSQAPLPMITYDVPATISSITITDNVVCAPTGVDMLEDETELISIYPNPASDVVLFGNLPNGCNLSVYNLEGQLVYTGYPMEQRLAVNNWAKGLYLFQFNVEEKLISRKVLIQ
ncbi:MAG: T9SS type A sorting domain-containing protein [Bacteroidia bacterium]